MTEEEKDEVVDSQKLTKKDKQEMQEGACVSCVVFGVIFMVISILAMVL